MPKVSIIIRTKNEERWIGSCLKSIFDQTLKDFEVILVDNNSTDNTAKEIKETNAKYILEKFHNIVEKSMLYNDFGKKKTSIEVF